MKKMKRIALLVSLNLTMFNLFCQTIDYNLYFNKAHVSSGDYVSESLYKTSYFNNIHYKVYKTPLDLPKLQKQVYDPNCHDNPHELLKSLRHSNSLEWLNKLYKGTELNWSDSIGLYRNSQQYRDNYLVKVISELSFKYEGAEYCAILAYSRDNSKKLSLSVFECKKIKGKWYFSGWDNQEECDKVTQLTGMLYLKPEFLRAALYEGDSKYKTEITPILNDSAYKIFKEQFFQMKIINSIPMSFGTYWKYSIKEFMPEISLKRNDLYIPSFEIDETVPFEIGVCESWSFEAIRFTELNPNYPNYNNKYTDFEVDYTSSSSALVSWLFSKTVNEKKSHYIGSKQSTDSITKSFNNPANKANSTWSIRIINKIEFDDSKHIYSLVFYSITNNGKISSVQSQLLRFQDLTWKVIDINTLNKTLTEITTVFDTLDFDILLPCFTNAKAKNSRIEHLAKDKFRGAYGRIYVNEIFDRYKYAYPFIGMPAKYLPTDFRSK